MSLSMKQWLIVLMILNLVLLTVTQRRSKGIRRARKRLGQNPRKPCFRDRRRILRKIKKGKLVDLLPPSCDKFGYYEPRQCNFHGCYCVDKFGKLLKVVRRGWVTNAAIACSGMV